jgi:hypothetical protein
VTQFKRTVIFYPLCIMAIWLPCVFLGVMANRVTDVPEIKAKIEARKTLATQGASMAPAEREALRGSMQGDDVLLLMLKRYAPLWLAGLEGDHGAVMASDSQILALSTMFTEDVFAHYEGKARSARPPRCTGGLRGGRHGGGLPDRAPGPGGHLQPRHQYAFSGYAALSPL